MNAVKLETFRGAYIATLSEKKQKFIEQEVKKALAKLKLDGDEFSESLERAMCGRLSDLDLLLDLEKVSKTLSKIK